MQGKQCRPDDKAAHGLSSCRAKETSLAARRRKRSLLVIPMKMGSIDTRMIRIDANRGGYRMSGEMGRSWRERQAKPP